MSREQKNNLAITALFGAIFFFVYFLLLRVYLWETDVLESVAMGEPVRKFNFTGVGGRIACTALLA